MKERKFLSRLIRKALVLFCLAVLFLAIMSMTAFKPGNLGVKNGRLATLPDSPNCVSSQTDVAEKRLDPLKMNSSQPLERLRAVIEESFPRAQLVDSEEGYLRFEFASLLFRFVDDVEFLFDGRDVHFRSASRVGYSDMGANRARIAKIRKLVAADE